MEGVAEFHENEQVGCIANVSTGSEASAVSVASPKSVLNAEGIHKAFGGQVVLEDVSLCLRPGEVVLLRGDNGSGKTTLINILTGHLDADAGSVTYSANGITDRFNFPLRFWQEMNPFDRFSPERVAQLGISRTWQDIRLFPSHTLLENIILASPSQSGENVLAPLFFRRRIEKEEARLRNEAATVLERLGLKGRESSSGDMISLGQARRVAISRAIQACARVLFLDEPLAGLDGAGIDEVMRLLAEIARQHKITLVIVEHVFNIRRVLEIADTVWTLKAGVLQVESPESVKAEIERGMLSSTCGAELLFRTLENEGWKRSQQVLPGGALLATFRHPEHTWEDVMLEVKELVVYRNRRLVIGKLNADGSIEGLSFCVRRDEVAILLAPNGWGKTTLLEAIAGIIPTARGTVCLNRNPLDGRPAWERSRAGLMFLRARDYAFPDLTVRDALRVGGIEEVPDDLSAFAGRTVSDLSEGERQRLALKAIHDRPATAVRLLDEPFSALSSDSFFDFISSYLSSQLTSALFAMPLGTLDLPS